MKIKRIISLVCLAFILIGQPSMANQLSPCPNTPNCVSSLATKKEQYVEPLKYFDSTIQSKNRLLKVINNMPRTKVVVDEELYLRITFTSLIFRFVDDVEFIFDDDSKLIQLKSASRVGNSDLGANRKRVEEIRRHFERIN